MTRRWLLSLAVLFALTSSTAWAGTAHSGQVNATQPGGLSKAEQALLGTWQIVAFQMGTTRRPFPARRNYSVTFRADSTFVVRNMPLYKKLKNARWRVRGRRLVVKYGKKRTQKLGFTLAKGELSVGVPGKAKYRIIFKRISKPRP